MSSSRKVAIVLWKGDIGGAEVVSASLAKHLRRSGVEATVVFVADPAPLDRRLTAAGIPFVSLGLTRGRDVLHHSRQYADAVSRMGQDGAILVERGFMGVALRVGGYRGRIVAVEHGAFNKYSSGSRYQRLLQTLNRHGGAWADDVEVAVSEFVLRKVRAQRHAERVVRIYNGIEAGAYPADGRPRPERPVGGAIRIGTMARLVKGKGIGYLIRAVARANRDICVSLAIAGDGPERPALISLADEYGLGEKVRFVGVVSNVRSYWQQCDIAVVPSAEWIETFSMVTLEAMACGKPIVATRNGAIPELVVGGETGALVPPASVDDLADAIVAYGEDAALRCRHGAAARSRALGSFDMRDCARAYSDLLFEGSRLGPAPSDRP